MTLVPLLFVALGTLLLLVAWFVWHKGQRMRKCVQDVLALPDHIHPMDWPLEASAVLQRAGIAGMTWRGQWFGDPVQGHWGSSPSPDWARQTLDAGPDCSVTLSWAGLSRTHEAKALALVVVDVFVQSWLSRMRQRTQAVAVALAQRAHVHLYWQHDMRNLAQWVGLMADEFGSASPDQLPQLAQRLQQQAPIVLAKAQKLLTATTEPLPGQAQQVAVAQPARAVLDVVACSAQLAGLLLLCDPSHNDPHISALRARALERTLDNIFSNVARDGAVRVHGRSLSLTWAVQAGQFQARLLTPHLSTPWPERPFEPMQMSTGSGLGLYQARCSLRDVGGELTAQPTPEGVEFAWRIPVSQERQIF
jgi:hypothetical protein